MKRFFREDIFSDYNFFSCLHLQYMTFTAVVRAFFQFCVQVKKMSKDV